ncbi:hypothetical protein EAH79_03690 [Sphingomonas koreensis]|nr:hypothetical protein EAH79_03690 [Sphingomonas koreensis]
MTNYQEDPTTPETPAERAVAKAEAAATRRRWLTLAEVVAIAGVVIAGLTLWNNWQGRQADQAEQRAAAAQTASAARAGTVVTLTAMPKDEGAALSLKDPQHNIQSIEVRFPSALSIAPQSSTVDLSIETDWFESALLKAIDTGPADQSGRLPVMITANYWDGEQHVTDAAIYDIAWRTHGRLLRGRALSLKGIVLERRHGVTQGAIDALWAKQKPKS